MLAACSTVSDSRFADRAEFDNFDAVLIDPVGVDFSEDWKPMRPLSRVAIPESDVERIRERIRRVFNQEFRASLERQGIRVVDEPGPNVLRITPALRDVVVSAPAPQDNYGDIYARTVGEATLLAAFSDSQSDKAFMLIEDFQRGRQVEVLERASQQYNDQRFGQMFEQWGLLIGQELLGPRYAAN
ncbi:MAG: DUF3313 family protein [Gammaproteobacteria bacterium]|nr:DUF3313 family protein [Gammaproteobacteria bacterium]